MAKYKKEQYLQHDKNKVVELIQESSRGKILYETNLNFDGMHRQ